ncbi:MAG: helix-turn-helix domain-containing protein [Acidimicrobiia bacterium]
MPDQMSLGDLIRQQRAALGLTQARLAELVGKSPSTVRSWERDRSRPADEASLSALAAVLGLSEDQVQLAMWTEAAPLQTADEPASTPSSVAAPAPDPEPALDEGASILESVSEPETLDAVETVEPAETARATEVEPVELPTPVAPPELETVVSEDIFSPPGRATSDRRFRLGDLADALRSTSAVSSRPRVPSYLDDPTEIRTYRLRTIMTAALLVFMIIVLLWAVGEARDAFSLIY